MSVRFPEGPYVIDIGRPEWCWSRLAHAGEGILSYLGPRGLIALAVPYSIKEQHIAIPLASINSAGWSAVGGEAHLEVSGLTSGYLRWVVRVTGTAQRAGESGSSNLAFSRRMHPSKASSQDTAAVPSQLVLLTPRVRGFYETPLVTS